MEITLFISATKRLSVDHDMEKIKKKHPFNRSHMILQYTSTSTDSIKQSYYINQYIGSFLPFR